MTNKTTKSPIAARYFKDADSGRRFLAGKPVEDVPAGVLENYRAAGLLRPDHPNAAEQIVADAQDAA